MQWTTRDYVDVVLEFGVMLAVIVTAAAYAMGLI